jgi:hypothetical protein
MNANKEEDLDHQGSNGPAVTKEVGKAVRKKVKVKHGQRSSQRHFFSSK